MKRNEDLVEDVSRLCDIEVEYDATIRVLAILVERLQEATGSSEIQLSDEAIADRPDLVAWRDPETRITRLRASR